MPTGPAPMMVTSTVRMGKSLLVVAHADACATTSEVHAELTNKKVRSDKWQWAINPPVLADQRLVSKHAFSEKGDMAIAVLSFADECYIGRADDGMAIALIHRVEARHV